VRTACDAVEATIQDINGVAPLFSNSTYIPRNFHHHHQPKPLPTATMATQQGLTVAEVNAPYTISTVPVPSPGPKQILVKGVVTAVNPVEPFMHHTGMLVLEWPAILGCEASGVVLAAGSEVTRFKEGDHVYGCSRLGARSFATFQDSFLIDEPYAFRQGDNLTAESACTIAVAIDTAALCLFGKMGLVLPKPGEKMAEKDEWVVVLGASGNVGQYITIVRHECDVASPWSCTISKSKMLTPPSSPSYAASKSSPPALRPKLQCVSHSLTLSYCPLLTPS
jgi:hypothetical protein